MKPCFSTQADASNLEAEYIQMKVVLYKNLFKYCITIAIILLFKEAVRAILYNKLGSLVMISVILIFGGFSVYFVSRLKNNQELTITLILGSFWVSTLLTQYHSNSGYFEEPIQTFNVAFAYAAFERIVILRISKFWHRTGFIVCTTTVRALSITPKEPGLFTMQFVYMFFTIYLDFDRERYDKQFFKTYFKNKEQLVKFKNLVVQDIPESIMIITQDLMKPLFVNNSFEQLIGGNDALPLRSKLTHFLIQESLENSQDSTQSSLTSLCSSNKQTLLTFLESTIHQSQTSQIQKFSCNLCYKNDRMDMQDQPEQDSMFEAKVIHLLWDEEPAIAVILHDITQQHTVLSLKIAAAHKDTVLATVSHELRTPLNGILGMIQIMQKRTRDLDMLNYLNICKNSGELLMSLVNSILDLNQIRAKKLKLNLERVRVSEMLESIVRLFELQCDQKGLELKMRIGSTCPEYVVTDKSRLSQIFINLVGNALKFTQRGGITISASQTLDMDMLTFSVEDTGAGIRDEDKNKLFQMFGKLEQSDRDVNPHGVGLGLTISDKLARLLGKDGIQLESQYGRGSRFSFSISKSLREIPIGERNSHDRVRQGQELEERSGIMEKMERYSRKFVKDFQQPTSMEIASLNNFSIDSLSSVPSMNFQSVGSMKAVHRHSSTLPLPLNVSRGSNSIAIQNTNKSGVALVVDDNPLNLIIAESLISTHGYKTKSALYGQVAIEIVLNCNYSVEPIKVIFMDCQMPVMDGFTATKALRKLMAERKIPEIPIVALTANDSDTDRENSRRAGMCEHISKPLKEAELVRILRKYMG